jgi:hypothetical protein
MDDTQQQDAVAEMARNLGARHGKGLAEFSDQYLPGGGRYHCRSGSTQSDARMMLAQIEKYGVETPDFFSGEYADGLSLSWFSVEIGVSQDDDAFFCYVTEFEIAASIAYADHIENFLKGAAESS